MMCMESAIFSYNQHDFHAINNFAMESATFCMELAIVVWNLQDCYYGIHKILIEST